MDFLSIRKKARQRAEAKEAASAESKPRLAEGAPPGEPPAQAQAQAQAPAAGERRAGTERRAALRSPPAGTPSTSPPEPFRERRRTRGDEPVLTEADLVEGALQARFQGLSPSPDGRFATWRPGAGPPPIEPDARSYAAEPEPPVARRVPFDAPPAASWTTAPAPSSPPPPDLAPASEPADPLDAFFYRPDEESGIVPALGGGAIEESVAPAPDTLDEFLTFRLGNEEFAVPIEHVREVLRAPNITEVPRAPANVLGVVAVRGEVVAVVDARARLGMGSGIAAGARIVIVDAGEGPLGLLVDAVTSVVRLPRGAIEPCPQGISAAASDCVTGIGRWKDRLFMVVDVAMLMGRGRTAEER